MGQVRASMMASNNRRGTVRRELTGRQAVMDQLSQHHDTVLNIISVQLQEG